MLSVIKLKEVGRSNMAGKNITVVEISDCFLKVQLSRGCAFVDYFLDVSQSLQIWDLLAPACASFLSLIPVIWLICAHVFICSVAT